MIFHFNTENILVSKQFSFKTGKTTTDCSVDFVDDITKAIDKGNYAVSIFLDLSKAFDAVNHSILPPKLDLYGIRAGVTADLDPPPRSKSASGYGTPFADLDPLTKLSFKHPLYHIW